MRRTCALCAAMLMLLGPGLTLTAGAQMNTSLYIEEIKYKRDGSIEIEFDDNTVKDAAISWTGRELVAVFDKNGAKVAAAVDSAGADWLNVRVRDVKPGETYTFEIRNVSYGARRDIIYTGFFVASTGWKIEYKEPPRFRMLHTQSNVAADDVFIKEIEYGRGGHIEVGFAGRAGKKISIEWNGNEKVAVTDETGRAYDARIVEYERNTLEIHVHDIVENLDYSLAISGIPYGSGTLSFKVSFKARDDWKYRPPRPVKK